MSEIIKKLHIIQCEVKGLEKSTQAFNYKYVSGDKLLHEIRPRMDALGLVLLPEVLEIKNQPITYTTLNKQGQPIPTTEVLTSIKMRFTWADSESGETLVQEWAGNGCNKFDKGFGSALTYAERYYLLKLFHIATDSDDVDYISVERDEKIQDSQESGAFGNWDTKGFDPFGI